MGDLAVQLTPIFVYFLIGVMLRRAGIAEQSHGDFLLKLVFFVTLPLLILTTLPNVVLTSDKALLPLANIVVNMLCLGAMLLATRRMGLDRGTLGAMAMNTMIVNNAFMFPFILAFYGESGFADAVLFDFGNALMVATVTYATAFRFSPQPSARLMVLGRVFKAPVFWALAAGVLLSVSGTALPAGIQATVEPVARMTAPLILIALGIFFSLSLNSIRLIGLALFIRMGLGFAFGLGFAYAVGLEGETLAVVALCSAAPIGFMALAFSSMARLDTELTTSAVSLSILIGLFYIPLLWLFMP